MTEETKRITELRIRDVLRLSAVDITMPEKGVLEITGKPDQGKSSVLKALFLALGGRAGQQPEPLRKGAAKGSVTVSIGNLKIVWTVTRKQPQGYLRITSAGKALTKQQTILDELLGHLFDPLAFLRMKAEERRAELARISGLDLSDLDAKRAVAYEARRDLGRDLKRAQAVLDQMPVPTAGLPKEPIAIADLTREYDQARLKADENKALLAQVNECRQIIFAHRAKAETITEQIGRTEAQLAGLKLDEQAQQERIAESQAALADAEKSAAALVEPDMQAIRDRMVRAEQVNARVQAAKAYGTAAHELVQLEKAHGKYDDAIAELDEQRAARRAKAVMPVPEMTIDDGGAITVRGVPFEQLGEAEKIRASCLIGMAANPPLHTMIVDGGESLGDEGRAALAALADERDYQIVMTRVTAGEDDGSLVIEDGHVKGVEPEPEAEVEQTLVDGIEAGCAEIKEHLENAIDEIKAQQDPDLFVDDDAPDT